jgi:ATP-dependent Clp protease ATP-binding subunit ClpB
LLNLQCLGAGVSKNQLIKAIQDLRTTGATVDSATGDQQFDALTKYGQDLTAKVATLDPVIGRDEEIRRVVRVLCRRTKNNPILIGEPGVGKTAIAGAYQITNNYRANSC